MIQVKKIPKDYISRTSRYNTPFHEIKKQVLSDYISWEMFLKSVADEVFQLVSMGSICKTSKIYILEIF